MFLVDLPPLPALLATLGAALMAGLARGFSGFGSALIFIPLASAALGPKLAAPLLLLVDNVTTLPLLPSAWRRADRAQVAALAGGAVLGAPFGTWLLLQADPVLLRWGICLLALGMLGLLASGWRYHGRPALPLSLMVGAGSGLCSGASQLGGPPVVAYWLGGAIPAAQVRANLVLFFAASGVISAAAYLLGGLLGAEAALLALMVSPLYALGVWGGSRMFGRASEAGFRRACFWLIGLAAVLGLPLWDRLR
ncbi:sulfite exporter TauE/SafE family protein [Roseomonas marmotae]|uniref:Probable membrane transporter protein n=1 Tax=Roseomonas marmotae TaxID=2768161 RepID=A0ABS3KE80_9PROT|nr:sulfite exporter TauE/SafE family protein [Roseomonas marmotae]MBO1075778.1 sulfite exporter TauE/SafE family protein [Roseomonas marmotae]QTI80504.1 sulfite exporter TauE/SafE family protein [Roseomonas marmotae]